MPNLDRAGRASDEPIPPQMKKPTWATVVHVTEDKNGYPIYFLKPDGFFGRAFLADTVVSDCRGPKEVQKGDRFKVTWEAPRTEGQSPRVNWMLDWNATVKELKKLLDTADEKQAA